MRPWTSNTTAMKLRLVSLLIISLITAGLSVTGGGSATAAPSPRGSTVTDAWFPSGDGTKLIRCGHGEGGRSLFVLQVGPNTWFDVSHALDRRALQLRGEQQTQHQINAMPQGVRKV